MAIFSLKKLPKATASQRNESFKHCMHLTQLSHSHFSVSYNEWESLLHQCTQLTKDYQTLTQLQDRYTSEPHRRKREVKPSGRTTIKPTYIPEGNKLGNVFILNGTNWCGTGNQARSFDDLGE